MTPFRQRVTIYLLITLLFASPIQYGCNTSKAVQGGAIGAGTGAAVGGLIGKKTGNTMLGALIGAAIGGTAGALIGNYMDKQAAEIEQDLDGAKVERIGEGIKITFDSGLMFDVNSSELKSVPRENLDKLSAILKKYDDTEILVEGHTDSSGSDDYNYKLSGERAQSVSSFLQGKEVSVNRLTVYGYGETQPIADNETDTGRMQNRRVDIAIYANDKLKKAAEKGEVEMAKN